MKLLTAQEVADILRVHRNTVYLWVRSGELPAVRYGKLIRIPQDSLEKWIKGRAGSEA